MLKRHLDLSDLINEHGAASVARVLGRSVRNLSDIRRGVTPATVDDLDALHLAYPLFSVSLTVLRLAAKRKNKGWSRQCRMKQSRS